MRRVTRAGVAGALFALVFWANDAFSQEVLVDQPGVTILPAPVQVQPAPAPFLPPQQPTVEMPPQMVPVPPPPRIHRWYGYQTLLGDGVVVVLGSVSVGSQQPTLAGVSVVGYFLAGPVIHWVHGRVGAGFADLGLRVAFPLGGTLLGAIVGLGAAGRNHPTDGAAIGSGVGAAVGAVGASIFDAAVLAEETVDAEPGEARAEPAFSVIPRIFTGKGSAALGLSGTF